MEALDDGGDDDEAIRAVCIQQDACCDAVEESEVLTEIDEEKLKGLMEGKVEGRKTLFYKEKRRRILFSRGK